MKKKKRVKAGKNSCNSSLLTPSSPLSQVQGNGAANEKKKNKFSPRVSSPFPSSIPTSTSTSPLPKNIISSSKTRTAVSFRKTLHESLRHSCFAHESVLTGSQQLMSFSEQHTDEEDARERNKTVDRVENDTTIEAKQIRSNRKENSACLVPSSFLSSTDSSSPLVLASVGIPPGVHGGFSSSLSTHISSMNRNVSIPPFPTSSAEESQPSGNGDAAAVPYPAQAEHPYFTSSSSSSTAPSPRPAMFTTTASPSPTPVSGVLLTPSTETMWSRKGHSANGSSPDGAAMVGIRTSNRKGDDTDKELKKQISPFSSPPTVPYSVEKRQSGGENVGKSTIVIQGYSDHNSNHPSSIPSQQRATKTEGSRFFQGDTTYRKKGGTSLDSGVVGENGKGTSNGPLSSAGEGIISMSCSSPHSLENVIPLQPFPTEQKEGMWSRSSNNTNGSVERGKINEVTPLPPPGSAAAAASPGFQVNTLGPTIMARNMNHHACHLRSPTGEEGESNIRENPNACGASSPPPLSTCASSNATTATMTTRTLSSSCSFSFHSSPPFTVERNMASVKKKRIKKTAAVAKSGGGDGSLQKCRHTRVHVGLGRSGDNMPGNSLSATTSSRGPEEEEENSRSGQGGKQQRRKLAVPSSTSFSDSVGQAHTPKAQVGRAGSLPLPPSSSSFSTQTPTPSLPLPSSSPATTTMFTVTSPVTHPVRCPPSPPPPPPKAVVEGGGGGIKVVHSDSACRNREASPTSGSKATVGHTSPSSIFPSAAFPSCSSQENKSCLSTLDKNNSNNENDKEMIDENSSSGATSPHTQTPVHSQWSGALTTSPPRVTPSVRTSLSTASSGASHPPTASPSMHGTSAGNSIEGRKTSAISMHPSTFQGMPTARSTVSRSKSVQEDNVHIEETPKVEEGKEANSPPSLCTSASASDGRVSRMWSRNGGGMPHTAARTDKLKPWGVHSATDRRPATTTSSSPSSQVPKRLDATSAEAHVLAAHKEQRRREIYAWNEALRQRIEIQGKEDGSADAV